MSEIRIGVVGNVDSGKSTSIAILTHKDILDNGDGSARKLIMNHPHEQESGRTSTVTKGYVELDNGNWMIFVDLAGHEKYLKTTLFGISGHEADYAMVVVGANMGVSKMTREHLSVVLSYRIPVYIVVSKIDICPPAVFEQTMADIQKLMKKCKRYKFTTVVENMDHVNQALDMMKQEQINYCPIFTTSNKTGQNLDLLKAFVQNLPPRYHFRELVSTGRKFFRIHERYQVKGVGLVLSGFMTEGQVAKDDTLYLGPIYGNWTKITVKSIHNNFRTEVPVLPQGQSGCIAIRLHDKRLKIPKSRIRKGVCVADQMYDFTRRFRAKVMIMTSHSTTVRTHYQPIIHCKTISQSAQICAIGVEVEEPKPTEETQTETTSVKEDDKAKKIKNRNLLRAGDVSQVIFRFMYRAEFLNPGDLFLFREGNVRGMGRVEELLPDEEPPKKEVGRRRRGRRAFEDEEEELEPEQVDQVEVTTEKKTSDMDHK